MKQTAVELIESEIKMSDGVLTKGHLLLIIEQAKAMEEEQLIMFGAQCMAEVEKESGLGAIKIYELYFDKTFKSE